MANRHSWWRTVIFKKETARFFSNHIHTSKRWTHWMSCYFINSLFVKA